MTYIVLNGTLSLYTTTTTGTFLSIGKLVEQQLQQEPSQAPPAGRYVLSMTVSVTAVQFWYMSLYQQEQSHMNSVLPLI